MKIRLWFITATLSFIVPLLTFSQVNYSDFFTDKTLRYDFILGGNSETINVYPQQMLEVSSWAGSKTFLTDELNYGTYRFRVFDSVSNTLLFSKGFATLFQEWQTTAEAKNMNRAFYQAIFFPYPKKKVQLTIEHRTWEGKFEPVFETEIDPKDYFIRKEPAPDADLTYIAHHGASWLCSSV